MMEWRKSSYSGANDGNCVEIAWRKSRHSGATGGNCVEVAFNVETVAVRDSKNTTGPTLEFSTAQWRAFTARRVRRP
jgi:uncharacterized protein DUF397